METQNKNKKGNNFVQTTPAKIESVKLKVGDSQSLQKIGECLLEKVQGIKCQEQPKQQLVNLFYDQSQGFARLKVGNQKISQNNSPHEELIYQNIVFEHANTCPHFAFSRLEEQFDMSQSTTTTGVAVCGIIIDKDNNVLLTKRSPEMRTYPRCWVFPGGQVDKGESFIQTVFREIKEEVGLNLLFTQIQIDNSEFEEDFEIIDKNDFMNSNQIEEEQEAEENIFKRKTRQQTKKIDQKKKQEIPQYNKKIEILTKSSVHLSEDPQPLFLYESVYPTDIRINYPQRSSLVIFYTFKIQESYRDIQLSQSKKEIDYSAWVPLDVLAKIIDYDSITDDEFLKQQIESGISINHNFFPIGLNCFVGKYPNQLGEGIGEAHIKALRMLYRRISQSKQNKPNSKKSI